MVGCTIDEVDGCELSTHFHGWRERVLPESSRNWSAASYPPKRYIRTCRSICNEQRHAMLETGMPSTIAGIWESETIAFLRRTALGIADHPSLIPSKGS